MARNHPHEDAAVARYARDLKLDRRSFPYFSLGMNQPDSHTLPLRIKSQPQDYITIHDGYEAASAWLVGGRATKTWNWTSWNEFVRTFKAEYPDIRVIQLGTTTARPIDGVDECLVNQTTLAEAFELISKSLVHIDGDSGLTHAATALGVPCVVLFGPTPDYFFGYPQNANLRAKTCSDACFWLKPDWLARCPIGYTAPKCMDDISTAEVLCAVTRKLQNTKAPRSERT